jgi:hypothetical protein
VSRHPAIPTGPRPLLVALTGLVVVVLLGTGVWLGIGLPRGDPGPPPPTTPSGAKVETVERLAAATVASFRTAGAVGGPEERHAPRQPDATWPRTPAS